VDAHSTFTKRLIMSPKEKAEDLVNKYRYVDLATNSNEFAKRYALIAVTEIISVIDPETNFKTWLFWKEVKKEIELI
jgi:hypothetical protein